MSLIDQALQKAYQQRSRSASKTVTGKDRTHEAHVDSDQRLTVSRELYLHKPQVPMRSHFASSGARNRPTRLNAEAIPFGSIPNFEVASEGRFAQPHIEPFAPALSLPEEPQATTESTEPTRAEIMPQQLRSELVEEPSYVPFHFHVTTEDTLQVDPSFYALPHSGADDVASVVLDHSPAAPEPLPVPAPEPVKVTQHAPATPTLEQGAVSAPLPSTPPASQVMPQEVEPETVDAGLTAADAAEREWRATPPVAEPLEAFQAAWEVDAFQLPWVCEQATGGLEVEIRKAVRDLPAHASQVFWVSSLLAGEGRTSIATLLSLSLAKEGQTVLLIQGDWQASSLAHRLGVALDQGWNPLETVSDEELSNLCVRSVQDNFTLLSASKEAAACRTSSLESITRLVEQLLPYFSAIVIDAPAGFGHRRVAVADTPETEILVQDVRKTPTHAIQQILDNVPSLQPRPVRIVQNFVPALGIGSEAS